MKIDREQEHVLDFRCPDCSGKWQVICKKDDMLRPANLLCLFCGSRKIEFSVRRDDTVQQEYINFDEDMW